MRHLAILATLAGALILLTTSLAMAGDILSPDERAWLQSHGALKVGAFEAYPPFGFVDDKGAARGMAVDYWRLMASKLDFAVVFKPSDFNRQLKNLASGAVDSSAGMFALPCRKGSLDFSKPYYPVSTYIFVRPRYAGIKGWKDLASLKVGVVQGDSGQVLCHEAGVKGVAFGAYKDAVLALARGKLDAMVMDEPVVNYWVARKDLQGKVVRVGKPVDRDHMALPVQKGNLMLLGILNKGVAAISPAEWRAIQDRYVR